MKKLIAVSAVAALAATALSAEVTFGGWGRQIWVPAGSNGDETKTATMTSWGWGPRMGYAMDFKSDNVDMHADFKLEDGKAEINDQLRVNIRPIEGVQLSIGKLQEDALRGDACFGSWNWIRPSWIDDEGWTFSRTVDFEGVDAKITAVENLVVIAGIPVPRDGASGEKTEDAFKKIKIGAGYTIEGVGVVKAQFLGKGKASDYGEDDTGDFEAAFKLTAVENLTAEVGFKMPILDDSDAAVKTVALGASYKANDALALNANFGLFLPGNSDADPAMAFGVGADYALENGLGLTADVRALLPQNDADPTIAFLAGVSKGFSNGKLSAGFQGVNVSEKSVNLKGDKTGFAGNGTFNPATDGFVWTIPVCFEYWF